MKIRNFKKSDEYRSRIHNIIPGGAHTYSKGDDQFPLKSPAAFTHGKGAYLWDLDGNEFLDCAMGLTSVSLGHAYQHVLDKVIEEIQKGANFQRPSYLEKEMAEKFLSLIPQHQMVKFAKNGSTVTTAAVKLARAKTGRDLVAFPSDHPFYSYDDWFIGSTPCSKGVPEAIKSLSVTYKADNLDSLIELFDRYPGRIACVISEPEKDNNLPKDYIGNAISLTHKNGALYILDEMITGFKTAFPGSITKYNVMPDMATWGKGIANGFAFCALTGTREVMELGGIKNIGAEKVFLTSTTHGAETVGMAACISTIEVFEKNNVIDHNHCIGKLLHTRSRKLISDKGLENYVSVNDTDWWPIFTFRDKNREISPGMKTLAMQEMISNGVLFNGFFVPCFSHSDRDVDLFIRALDDTLITYSKALEQGIEKFLEGPIIKPVFRKYI
jgi:glutamate-1-semialdehyde 2,1-aminomutase